MRNVEYYGKVYAKFLDDRRTHAAARRLAHLQGVPEEWAVHAVLGLVAQVDRWLNERGTAGEDGELPDDGFAVLRTAGVLSPSAAKAGLASLLHGGWLARRHGKTVRVGYKEDYRDLLKARETSRNWRKERKEAAAEAPPDPTVGPAYDTRTIREGRANGTPSRGSRASEPQTALAVASDPSSIEPAVDVPPASTAVQAAAEAPGREGGKACGRCIDGLVARRGRKPRCCKACDRGRQRARHMARAIQDEQAQARRLQAARATRGRELRDRGPESVGILIPGALARLQAGAGLPAEPPSGPRHGAA